MQFGSVNQNTDPVEIRRYNPGEDVSVLAINIGDNPGAEIGPGDELLITAGGQTLFLFRTNGIAATIGTPAWSSISDVRAKHDIQPLTGVLDQVLQLKGHSFFYNEPNQPGARAGKCLGFVAQEVEPIFPEWVSTDHAGTKSMHIAGFEALAVEALRDLRAEKDAEIEALRQENHALHDRLEAIEAMLQTLTREAPATP